MKTTLIIQTTLLSIIVGLPISVFSQATTKENCKNAVSTSKMRKCLQKEYTIENSRLNKSYLNLYNVLQPLGQKKLKAAQQAWIKFRDTECDFAGYQEYGGTLSLIITDTCHLEFTKKRIEELNKYIAHFK